MKKLWLTLVFVLIAVMCLTFAVSAADAEKLTGLGDVAQTYEPSGAAISNNGWNGGSYTGHAFDGSYGSLYQNTAGRYVIVDLNAKLAGGYYLTEAKIYHAGNTQYSIYYTTDGSTWKPIAEKVASGTGTYAINDYAVQFKYVFDTTIGWTPSLQEIELYGIDPSLVSCSHSNLTEEGWVAVEGSATCTTIGNQSQTCPDCGEVLIRESAAVPALGHDFYTEITKEGTSVSYGEGIIKCTRCDYALDFKGEVDLTDSYYAAYSETAGKYVVVLPSSIGHQSWGNKAEYLTDGVYATGDNNDSTGWGQWYADTEDDENEYVILSFMDKLDLTKVTVGVANDSAATLRISARNMETGEFVVVKELSTYDESLGSWASLTVSTSLLGVTTDAIKFQVISPSNKHDGFVYKKMIITEIDLYGIAPGCGLDADNHECTFDTFVDYVVAPTCQTAGTATYKCACNATTVVEVAASEEFHKYIEVADTRVEATCSAAGSYLGKCEYCEGEKTIEIEINPEAHNYSETDRVESTCTTAGYIEYTCSACGNVDTEELKLADHVYGEAVVDEPDCENAGSKTWTCEVCEGTKVEEIAALGHTWEIYSMITEPTCGAAGEANYVCSVCEKAKEDTVPATGNHLWDTENYVVVNAPTCEGSGYGTYTCLTCGGTKNDFIAALGHSWTIEVEGTRVDATCKEAGTVTYACANCDKVATQTIPIDTVNGHKYDATENEDGSYTYKCSICGKTFQVNNALVNGEYFMGLEMLVFENGTLTVGEKVYAYTYNVTEGMITTDDSTVYFQVLDGKLFFKGAEQLHQHTADVYVAEEQEDGSIIYTCNFCGDVYVVDNDEINGTYFLDNDQVVFDNGVVTGPFGTAKYTYNVTTGMIDTDVDGIFFQFIDGAIYFRSTAKLHQHVGAFYTIVEVDGVTVYQCNYCDYTETINNAVISGTYYNLSGDEVVFADGKVTLFGEEFDFIYNQTTGMIDIPDAPGGYYYQVIDGVLYFKGAEPLHQHDELEFVEYIDEPTCTEDGTALYICQFCGEIEGVVEATGHGETVIETTVDATCTTPGSITYVCADCLAVVSVEEIPVIDHAWVEADYQPATCSQAGYQNYVCENCDATKTEELPIDETEHTPNYSLDMESKDANCKEDGYFKYTCFYCGNEVTEITPANPDSHQNVTVEYVAATCQTAGYETYKCSICGLEGRYDYPASENAHVETETAIEGGYQYTCTLCGATRVEITKGTAFDPIPADKGSNKFEYYETGEDFVVYSFYASDAGTITVTTIEGVRIYVGYNIMGWYYGGGSTNGTYSFEADQAGDYLIAIATDAETLPETFNVSFTEITYPTLELGDNTITIDGVGESIEYVVNVPGDYILTLGDNASAYIIYGPYSSELVETGFEFTVEEGEKVKFAIGTGDFQPGEVVVTLDSANVHTHTEEVIPMVLPTPSVDGYTAGIKCSECDEIIVAPELITVTDLASNAELRYRGASLTPKENISVNYQLQVPAGYTNVYTVFVFLGEEYVVTDYKIDASNGRYVYKFLYAFPQLMQENITAYAYAINENGEWVRNVRDGYSIQAYCESQLKPTNPTKLLTAISDILVMGAETQKYMGYKTDSLVTDLVKANGFTLTPTEFTSIDASENVQALVGTKNQITDWTGGSLVLGASTKMKLTFKTDTIENVQIKIVIDGVETIYDAEDIVPNKEAGKYDLEIDTITVLQFGTTVEGVILKDGVQVGRTMNYSINSYLYKNYNASNVGALCKALYNYGISIGEYFG